MVIAREAIVVGASELERDGDGLLERRGRPDRDEVVHLADARGELRRRDDPADAPPGDRERLARAGDRDGPLGHPLQGRDRDVGAGVLDVLVDLVGHADRVVIAAETRDELELGAREDASRRVVRGVHDDRPGSRGERAPQLVRVEREARRAERNEDRRSPADGGVRAVILIERLEDDDLVTGVDDREQRRDHRFRRSAGDREHRLRIDRHRVEVAVRPGERVAEGLAAPGDRVLVEVGVDRALRRLLHLRGRGEVGEALREVDAAVHRVQSGHLADDRLGETHGSGGKGRSRGAHQYPAAKSTRFRSGSPAL